VIYSKNPKFYFFLILTNKFLKRTLFLLSIKVLIFAGDFAVDSQHFRDSEGLRADCDRHVLVQRGQAALVVDLELRGALRQRHLRQGQAAGDGAKAQQQDLPCRR